MQRPQPQMPTASWGCMPAATPKREGESPSSRPAETSRIRLISELEIPDTSTTTASGLLLLKSALQSAAQLWVQVPGPRVVCKLWLTTHFGFHQLYPRQAAVRRANCRSQITRSAPCLD